MDYELAKDLAEKALNYFKKSATINLQFVLDIEKDVLMALGAKEDSKFYDELFCAYYVGAITTEELIEGLSE